MADVFLHVGLPKTGTTTLQAALDHHVDDLAAEGVLFPGGRHEKQRLAVFDLLGQRLEGDERKVAGAFPKLVEEMAAFDGRSIIVTEEILGMARPRQVRRFVDALATLGPLVNLGEPRSEGGDWERTADFGSGEAADLRLPVLFDAEFRGGRGRIELEFSARRRGREVTTGLESLRVVPAKR